MTEAPIEARSTGPDALPVDTDGDDTWWSAADDPAQGADDLDAAPDALDGAAARAGLSRTTAAGEQQLAGWIEAVIDRDERALAALYDATSARVFGIVQRIVRRTALAEEVVEDTYFQVWRQAVRFDPQRGSAITWLLAMARSRAIDAVRREARFQHDTLDDEHDTAPASAATPGDELLDAARHHAALHHALLQLGGQPRQLVSLAFFRGLSHEEIASQTCLPLGTVKSQIRRALIALRQILGHGDLGALPI